MLVADASAVIGMLNCLTLSRDTRILGYPFVAFTCAQRELAVWDM